MMDRELLAERAFQLVDNGTLEFSGSRCLNFTYLLKVFT